MKQSIVKRYHGTPFSVECSPIVNKPGIWGSTKVIVFRDTLPIGEYIRNYPTHSESTFYPFNIDGQWFALYSTHYTATRIMKIHENRIEDWCGEDPASNGFCPIEFYVPKYSHSRYTPKAENLDAFDMYTFDNEEGYIEELNIPEFIEERYVNFGFLAGCVWGDDTGLKLKFIDLSKILDKQLLITYRFGDWALPGLKLNQCISLVNWEPDYQLIELVRAESIII